MRESPNVDSFELSRARYEAAAGKIALLIKEAADVSLPEETLACWRQLLSSMRVIDSRLDGISDARHRVEFMDSLLSALSAGAYEAGGDMLLDGAVRTVSRLMNGLDEERARMFINTVRHLLRTTEHVRTTREPADAVRNTVIEGQLAARLLLPFLPAALHGSREGERISQLVKKLGRVANTFDTLVDLREDASSGQVAIAPNMVNHFLFTCAVLTHTISFFTELRPSSKIAKSLISSTIATLRDRTG